MDWRDDKGDYLAHPDRSEWLVAKLARIPKWASILDIGCNAGRDLRALYARGNTNLTGLDMNDGVLSIPWPIRLIRSDAAILTQFRHGAYDAIISVGCIEHIHDEAVIRAIGDVSSYWIALVTIQAVGENYHPWWYKDLWPNHHIIDECQTPPGLYENKSDCESIGYRFYLFER